MEARQGFAGTIGVLVVVAISAVLWRLDGSTGSVELQGQDVASAPGSPVTSAPARTAAPPSGTTATRARPAARTVPGTTPARRATPRATATAGVRPSAEGRPPGPRPTDGRLRFGRTSTGHATFYGATGAGNCMFPAGGDRMIAAIDDTDYDGARSCGAYLAVTGPDGTTITVRIVDRCPECGPGDLDLSAEAFARLAAPSAGRVPVSWRLLSPGLSGPVTYLYKTGSSVWWCAVQVRDHRNPVRTLEVRTGGRWRVLPRQDYNYFLSADGAGCGGDLRVTDVYGNQVTDVGIRVDPDVAQRGHAQFGPPR